MNEKAPLAMEATDFRHGLLRTACLGHDLTVGLRVTRSFHTYLRRCQCNQLSGRFPGVCSASCISPLERAGKESRDG